MRFSVIDAKGYYSILRLNTPLATPQEIKQAYDLQKKTLNAVGHDQLIQERLGKIEAAYKILSDPQQRAIYDAERILPPPKRTPASSALKPRF